MKSRAVEELSYLAKYEKNIKGEVVTDCVFPISGV
jgi:hypothetical protein